MYHAKDIDVVISMYNLIKYSNNYSKTSGILWQYYRDESAFDNNGANFDFLDNDNNSASFKFKTKIASRTGNNGNRNVQIMVSLKYLRRTVEIPLINCEVNLILTWSANCFITDAPVNNQIPKFKITNTKLYVPVVTLSTEDNAKHL